MTAPNRTTQQLHPTPATDEATVAATTATTVNGRPLTAVELLNPDPVSKRNLYVLIGCTVLVAALIIAGPWLYPHVEQFTSSFWN